MPERINQMSQRFVDFWNRYNAKQKTLALSTLAGVILTMVILVALLSRPQYELLATCDNYSEMSQVTTILDENGYEYLADDAKMTISVKSKDLLDTKMLLARSEIEVEGYGYEDALESSFSSTESDKLKSWQVYLEFELEEDLRILDKIDDAEVNISLVDNSNSLFQTTSGSTCHAILTLNTEMDEQEAENIAYLLKNTVPNLELKDITIISKGGESLYCGSSNSQPGSLTALTKQMKYVQQMNNITANDIRNQVLSTGLYGEVKVNVNYDIEMSKIEEVLHEYFPGEGNEEGYLLDAYIEKSQGGSTVGGTPGTESNDEDTDYVLEDGTGSSSKYSLEKYSYQLSELVTTKTTSPGEIVKDTSTISAVFTKNVVYDEDDVKALGYLDDVTWEEFKARNAETIQIQYDEDWIDIISTGSGVPRENISIIAYEKHFFYDSDGVGANASFIMQILLALAILGLLAFVVFRSSRPITVEETEPELSVEQMLATTRETQQTVEDIDLQEKSEVRKAIEKFVDESPEAVALLLRNWLDDGWD